MTYLLLAASSEDSIYSLIGLLIIILKIALGIYVASIPAMILYWTKNASREIQELRSQLAKAEVNNIKHLKAINAHLKQLDDIATAALVEEE